MSTDPTLIIRVGPNGQLDFIAGQTTINFIPPENSTLSVPATENGTPAVI